MEVHIYQPIFAVYHVAVFLLVAFKYETVFVVLHAVFAQQHEKFLYPEVIQRLGIRTTERGVHLHTGHTCFRSWMQHFIPFLAALQVLFFHLFQSGKLGDVLHDQVHVDVAVLFCCSDILPGIVIKLVHNLHLETPEGTLNCF